MISRRNVLRGGIGVAAAASIGGTAGGEAVAQAPALRRTDAEIYGVTTVNPLVTQRADPFITPRTNGMYYFTGSVPEYDRVVVRGASTLAGLSNAPEAVVWRRPSSGRMGGHIWAPELHRIDNRWYIYFAAGDSDNVFRIRTYVLESARADPLDPAGWVLRGQMLTEWDSFTLDATTFAHNGRRYLVWAQSEPEITTNSNLYIAEMGSPLALRTKPVRIATPTRSWEIQGFRVNEGPAVIIRNGRVFMTFSASATDSRYCVGLLTASAGANLLSPSSWVKTPDPVFTTNANTSQYGPGHNSFTVAEDGVTDVLVYHARDYRDIAGDPLYDPNRHTRVQKLYWHSDGTPLFGVPVGKGGPIVRLSPADSPAAPGSYVRHYDYVLRVEAGVRLLADTQFRFVPAGDGTERLQSVNFPNRYVRVSGTSAGSTVRIDPVEAGTTSFRRVASGNGVTLEVAGAPGTYLRHEAGRLTVGAPTVFLLS